MLAINGSFKWFSKLPGFVQTLIVAGTLVGVGFTVGLLFHTYKGLPGVVQETAKKAMITDSIARHTYQNQLEITQTLLNMKNSLAEIRTEINTMHWHLEVISCYQTDMETERQTCIENARKNSDFFLIPPSIRDDTNERR